MNQDNRPPRRGTGHVLLCCALALGVLLGAVERAPAAAKSMQKAKIKPQFRMQKAKVVPKVKGDDASDSDDADHTTVRLTPKLKKTDADRPEPAATPTVTPDDVAVSKARPKTTPRQDDAEQARLAAARKAEEERLAQLKAERLAEEKRLAEAKKKAEEADRLAAKKAEADRLAHEKALAEMREASKKKDEKDEEPSRVTRKTSERQAASSSRRSRSRKPVELDEVKDEEVAVAKAATPKASDAKPSGSSAPDEDTVKTALAAQPSPESRLRLEQMVTQTKDRAALHALSLRLGDVDMALGDAASAESAYQVAVNAAPNAEASRAAGEKLAQAATGHGDFQAASRQFATLRMAGSTPDPRMLNAEALTLAAASDYANAEKVWAEFETASASAQPAVKADALLGQALTAELKGQRDKAQQMLRRVTAEFANTPQAALAQKRLADLKEPVIP